VSDKIRPIVMPKWGLAMTEGTLVAWHVAEGAAIEAGTEIADIETSKITNVFEAPVAGKLRRQCVAVGEGAPVGALLAVVTDDDVSDAEIDAFIADFREKFATAQAEAGPAEIERQFVETPRGRFRYVRMGQKKAVPIVLIHGFGSDLESWLFVQEDLAAADELIAIDLPGHGGSTKEVGPGTVDSLAEGIRGALAALGVERAHLVGHSLGGAVALTLVLSHPELVAGVSLIAPAALGSEINAAFIDGFLTANRRKTLIPVLGDLVANRDLIGNDMAEAILRFKRLDGAEAALRQIADACFKEGRQSITLPAALDRIGVPLTAIWGEADRIIPARHIDNMPPSGVRRLVPGVGHLPHMEAAAAVRDELLAAHRRVAGAA
jgi:pyruvate dehydrogenase E2 component (dihydrolipoamide acetyltransferase)